MKKRLIKNQNDHAVSEAIGFTLIFSLVMIGIGLITLYGYPVLLETQSNANVRNMERDMIVLQNDMKSLVYKNVPYKETSLQVSGGALAVHNVPSSFELSVNAIGGGEIPVIKETLSILSLDQISCGQLRYESDAGEAIIALENGAVLTRMEFQNGSAMLSEPRWFIDENAGNTTMIITFMNISADAPISRIGIGIVKMKLVKSEFYASPTDQNGMIVRVTYNKDSNSAYDFSKAWENYLTNVNTVNMDLDEISGNSYKFSKDGVNTLVVKRYDIKILSL